MSYLSPGLPPPFFPAHLSKVFSDLSLASSAATWAGRPAMAEVGEAARERPDGAGGAAAVGGTAAMAEAGEAAIEVPDD